MITVWAKRDGEISGLEWSYYKKTRDTITGYTSIGSFEDALATLGITDAATQAAIAKAVRLEARLSLPDGITVDKSPKIGNRHSWVRVEWQGFKSDGILTVKSINSSVVHCIKQYLWTPEPTPALATGQTDR